MANRTGIKGRDIELYVKFIDSTGEPANSDETPTVAIWDSTGVRRQAPTNVGVSLVDDPGIYKFSYEIPLTLGSDGYWQDIWTAKIGNSEVTNTFYFNVLSSGAVVEDVEPVYDAGDTIPWDFTKDEIYGVNILLQMLKFRVKNDGVRKISDGVGGYTTSECNVFSDEELICFLINSLSEFNQYPHFTGYKFSDSQTYGLFAGVIVQGAVLLALAAQAIIEKGREFTINDSGVTFTMPAISEILNTQYNAQLADYKEKLKMIKCSLKPSPISLGSYRITAIAPAWLRLRHRRSNQII